MNATSQVRCALIYRRRLAQRTTCERTAESLKALSSSNTNRFLAFAVFRSGLTEQKCSSAAVYPHGVIRTYSRNIKHTLTDIALCVLICGRGGGLSSRSQGSGYNF